MKIKQDYFEILRRIKEDFKNQRQMAKELNFSLGKLNYCLTELKAKGLVKIQSFKNNPMKIKYVLTPRGIELRTNLTIDFMKRKMKEYEELKKELKNIKKGDLNEGL
jgi:EPS-associated MarR family transcriptional regulator|tara:strand:+ start:139 stop:459 length:321 start_codon:yes stop_codon:yes gene_type:complete